MPNEHDNKLAPSCATCRHFLKISFDAYCRRFPPVPVAVSSFHSDNDPNNTYHTVQSCWPEVRPENYCGEWAHNND
jgi:hypothetical protein